MSPSKFNLVRSAKKNLFTQPPKIISQDSDLLNRYILRGCVKCLFTALRAKLDLDRHMISTISRSEIVEIMCLSKENSAAEGGKNLFTQPLKR